MSLIGDENNNKIDLKSNSVEEVRLRKRRDANKAYEDRRVAIAKRQKMEMKKQRLENQFLTPEKVIKRSIDRKNDKKRIRRQAKRLALNQIPLDTSDELLAVVRIHNPRDASKQTKTLLSKLRLTADYAVVFIRRTPKVMHDLVLVEPFVAWGHPTLTTIQELLSKRAFAMIDNKRVPVSDNTVVEDHLGDKGLICVADMEHEIQTMGPAFDAVNSFLAPFVLDSPFTKSDIKWLHNNKIPAGDQGEKINEIIKGML